MSILSNLMNSILGHGATSAVPSSPATPGSPLASGAAAATATAVDVTSVLTALAAKRGERLNWQTSIVDLMKLVGLDSSLAERKELAKELGFSGDMQDTASMNTWLHQQVMKQLAEHGGKLPADLLHH